MASRPIDPLKHIDDSPTSELMVGRSAVMKRVFQLTRVAAASQVPVLLSGEIGTGKDQIARSIHQLSGRSQLPWVAINCRSDPPELIEQLIFGQGSYPSSPVSTQDLSATHQSSVDDPLQTTTGALQAASGGTVYLSEVDRLSDTAQLRLLQVLLEGQYQPPHAIGISESGSVTGTRQENRRAHGFVVPKRIRVDVRIVAASHRDLSKEVAEGRFREDLYWCLNVFPIGIPPLRRRGDDIEPLVQQYLKTYSAATQKSVTQIHPKALAALREYPFPGNLRELQNYVLRAIVLATEDQLIPELLPVTVTGGVQDAQSAVFRPTDDEALLREFVYSQLSKSEPNQEDLFDQVVGPLEKELIIQVLDLCNQTQIKAAKRLGIGRNTLYKKLVEYGLAKPKTDSKTDSKSDSKE